MPTTREALPAYEFAGKLLQNNDEPKPIIALYKMLTHLTSNPNILAFTQKEQNMLIKVLMDQDQVDLPRITVRMRNNILGKVLEMAKYPSHSVARNADRLIKDLMRSIGQDISSLEERPVVDLMNNLVKSDGLNLRPDVRAAARNLFNEVNDTVTNMAVQNAELVDLVFMMDYLSTVAP